MVTDVENGHSELTAHSVGAVEYNEFPLNECSRYDTKQSDGEASVMLELWGMQITLSFPSLPGSLWPGEEAPERIPSMGQKELLSFKLRPNKGLMLLCIIRNWTV